MSIAIPLAWLMLALIHIAPAAVLFRPSLIERLYGVAPDGDVGVLLIHRGAMFLAVVAVSLLALLDPNARRAASIVAAVSVIGFLLVYWRAGMPDGPLRTIAIADLVAIFPLALVTFAAWRQATP